MADLKSGFKSLEYYLAGAAVVVKLIWKDFPDQAFLAIIAYVVARQTQKGFGLFDPIQQKYSWQTSEFWMATLYAVAKSIFPDMPEESLVAVLSWIGLRTGIKGMKVVSNMKRAGTDGIATNPDPDSPADPTV